MAITLETIARNAGCNAIVDLLDAGAGAGTLKFYVSGGGTLLATLTFSDPAFGNASVGVATASAITADSSADATGTAALFRFYDSDNNLILSGTVGTSGADINFNTVSWTAGDNISVTSLTVTQPAS
jgi:hypothetical protein